MIFYGLFLIPFNFDESLNNTALSVSGLLFIKVWLADAVNLLYTCFRPVTSSFEVS